MSASNWPTQSPEALLSFVEGRGLFRNYLDSGRADDLGRARSSFSDAERNDPRFALATFYLAVVESELRDPDSAILRLESLTRRQVDFLPETYLQLAYAHTKKYQDADYFEAERCLNEAHKEARTRRRTELVPVIDAQRIFLFSVMGGRLRQLDPTVRREYLRKAISLGERLLLMDMLWWRVVGRLPVHAREEILFETHNALGIAYMRKGEQHDGGFSPLQQRDWERAARHYDRAVRIRPNATRVLQNIGTLRLIEGDQSFRRGEAGRATTLYRSAQELYYRSLDLNAHDQFPHYRIAELAAKLGDWDTALRFYQSGRQENGAVREPTWERLRRVIQSRDTAELYQKTE